MLACTEMITMCLQSAKREHLRSKQQQHQMQDAVHGLPIFHDIFRRADKNDDGKLSFEEFKAYFADGILTTDELRELFYSIDGRQTNNLDTDKLSEFCAVFLCRVEVKVPEHLIIQKNNRRCGRRVQKNMCLSPTDPYSGILTTGVTVDTDEHWCSQINRLQQLIDKLECQSPKLEPLKEDTLASTYKSNILLVQRQMSVTENDLEEFQKALKTYADTTANQNDNLHVSIQKLPEKNCYIIYEFWQDRISWMRCVWSKKSKLSHTKRCQNTSSCP
ncbi:N-terminal EF-hand calcium-binding protein 1-like [Sinocyclocheilus grahami]|uniref:N-terminal EF-hand calcium-binding protein 1-like n=1 Tax=Sinocyclocheilus grahami TaxID=75366 RepID=UPI0007ACDEFC|nr:PREDICTED: N-terminal EF-hand calcium-binding protein 1-like [Sinocyclocheilus grahami]